MEPRQALAAVIAGDETGLRRLAELLAPYLPVLAESEPDRWLNAREAAEYAGTTANALHKAMAARELRFEQDTPLRDKNSNVTRAIYRAHFGDPRRELLRARMESLMERADDPEAQRDQGDGTSATGATVAHAFGAAGEYTATATLTDAAGHTTTTSGQVAVTDPPAPAAAGTITPPPPDQTAPTFTTKPAIHGTALTFGLSEAANVLVTITRNAKGVRKGRSRLAPPRHKTNARPCTRVILVATLHTTITGRTGKLTLPAKVRRTAGTYTITLTVRDAAGNASTTHLIYRVATRRPAPAKRASELRIPPPSELPTLLPSAFHQRSGGLTG